MTQKEKAKAFGSQHKSAGLVILPNVWDVMSAKLMESAGFPSIATASIALAAVNGYQDGQHIPLELLLRQVANMTKAVSVPVSVDFERGYMKDPAALTDNIQWLLDTGAIGLNIEDSLEDKSGLKSIAGQCRIIETVRNTAVHYGVDLFINARTDAYIRHGLKPALADVIERGKAYKNAGADCLYPILLSDIDDLKVLAAETAMPVNVLLTKPLADLEKLAEIGIKRVSLGPGVLKYALTKILHMAKALQQHRTDIYFETEMITPDFLAGLVS